MQIYEGRPSLSLIHSVVKPRSSSFSLSYIRKYYDDFFGHFTHLSTNTSIVLQSRFQKCGWLKEVRFFVEQLYVLTTVQNRENRSSWL